MEVISYILVFFLFGQELGSGAANTTEASANTSIPLNTTDDNVTTLVTTAELVSGSTDPLDNTTQATLDFNQTSIPNGQCNLPLSDGSWLISSSGTWIIKSNGLVIDNVETILQPASTLTCETQSGTKYLFSTTVEIAAHLNLTVYTCIDIRTTSSSPEKYLFYFVTARDENNGAYFTANLTAACLNNNYEVLSNTHIVIKEGSVYNVTTSLPNVIRGVYTVNFTTAHGAYVIGSTMDSYSDASIMAFNQSDSSKRLGFSASGVFLCIYTMSAGDLNYVITYNNDTTLDFTTYRFACWIFSNSSSDVAAVVYPHLCQYSNITAVATGGQTLTFQAFDTTTTIATTTSFMTTEPPFDCSVFGNSCMNNGTCGNSSRCDCLEDYTGHRCEYHMDCNTTSCMNGGMCNLTGLYYKCECSTGDPEKSCALNDVKECTEIPVLSMGTITCIDRIDGYELICAPNFTGPGCSKYATDDVCKRHGGYYCTNIDYCKPRCNYDTCGGTQACEFSIKPFEDDVFVNNTVCIHDFANGYINVDCETEDLLFDGLDGERKNLTDCSPYFTTICTADFNNGVCNPVCNNTDCVFDGEDCLPPLENRPFLPGGVVLQLKTLDWQRALSVTKLLLRSRAKAKPGPFPVPHVYMNIGVGKFSKISSVGKFLAAAFAKLPDLLQLTDIFYCERGYYSSIYTDKCNHTCSPYCVDPGPTEDICEWNNGGCLHGCKQGYWGNYCTFACPQFCKDTCNSIGDCHDCQLGYWGKKCAHNCPPACSDNCDRNGRCNCSKGYYWSEDTTDCMPCSDKCADKCDHITGRCACKPPYYGHDCGLSCSPICKDKHCNEDGSCKECNVGGYGKFCDQTCPERCPQCDKNTGNCRAVCAEGYSGNNCQSIVGGVPVRDHTGVIIAVILAISIVALILIITYCCWKRRQSGDYVLEDEEREPVKCVKQVDTLQAQQALTMQPIVTGLGKSTDMIDMDDNAEDSGIYTGPKRNTIVSSTVVISSNQTTDIDGAVTRTPDPESYPEESGTARTSWSVDAKYIDVSSTDDELDGYGEDGSVTNEGKVMLDFDREANLPPDTPDDSDHEANVPIGRSSMAPLASEEDILMSKENLLEEEEEPTETEESEEETEKEPKESSRKSSTSSKSSSSSDSSKSNSNSDTDNDKKPAVPGQ